jgi:hypothetical protein
MREVLGGVIMNKKSLIRIIVVFVIAAAIFFVATALAVPTLAVWIYLVFVVWKKQTNIFHDQMEPKLAERRLKRLKTFLLVAGISLAVGIVGVILHNAIYGLSEIEEPVSFFIAISALWVFIIATIGGLVIFLKGRRKTT